MKFALILRPISINVLIKSATRSASRYNDRYLAIVGLRPLLERMGKHEHVHRRSDSFRRRRRLDSLPRGARGAEKHPSLKIISLSDMKRR